MNPVQIGPLSVGGGHPLVFIVGPCVIESTQHALDLALAIRDIGRRCAAPIIFKASYDKANRTSIGAFRGPGLRDGLAILRKVKEALGVPVISDIHSIEQVLPAAKRSAMLIPRDAARASSRSAVRESTSILTLAFMGEE